MKNFPENKGKEIRGVRKGKELRGVSIGCRKHNEQMINNIT
jgi:hypothetical protein